MKTDLCEKRRYSTQAPAGTQYTEAQALAAFVAYMNQKAAAIGMKDSLFRDPAGIDNLCTAHDLLLPSGNVTAMAIARNVGRRLLEQNRTV